MKNKPYPLYQQSPEYTTVRELLCDSARRFGDAPSISYRNRASDAEKHTLSYRELEKQVRAAGTEMLARGWHGKHCAVIGKLSYSWVICYFALLSIGAVMVPLDPEWSAEDLADTARQAGVYALVCDSEIAAKAPAVCKAAGIDGAIYTKSSDGETVEDLVRLGQARVDAGDTSFDAAPIDPAVMALLVFTSGTTGQGKGVMLSQHAILTDIAGAQQIAKVGKKMIGVLPPHHTFGSTIGLLVPVYMGTELYISGGLRYFAHELQQEHPDTLVLVPLFLETFAHKILAAVKEQGKDKLLFFMMKVSNGLRRIGIDLTRKLFASVLKSFGGNLEEVICGGAPMSREVYYLFSSLGITLMNGYGITECSPLISVNRPEHIIPGTVGMPIPADSVRIDCPNEEGEGEICVKGPNVMLGYFNNEEATRAVIDENGYFHTGDIGKLHEQYGYIYITGRIKNLIILSNGKNVYPEEIESEFAGIPGVGDIVVYEGQSRRGITYNKIVAEFYMDPEYMQKEGISDARAYLQPYVDKYNKTAVIYKRVGLLRVRPEPFPKNTLRKITRFKIDRTIE